MELEAREFVDYDAPVQEIYKMIFEEIPKFNAQLCVHCESRLPVYGYYG